MATLAGVGAIAGCASGTDRPQSDDVAPATSSASTATAAGSSQFDGLAGSTAPDFEVDGVHERTFTQTVDGRETTLDVDIPVGLYEYYRNRTRSGAYGAYVSDGYDDEYVGWLAEQFTTYGREEGLTRDEVLNHVIGFVQTLEYATDEVGTGFDEYPKYPVETLVERGGDCEDTSILLAAIAESLGYPVVLLAFPDASHMALGIGGEDLPGTDYEYQGRRYYYLETTAPGWDVGQLPDAVGSAPAHFMPVDASPVLVMKWQSGAGPERTARFEVLVRNVGDAPARDVQVQIDLQTEDEAVVSSVRTDPMTVSLEGDERVRAALQVPPDRVLRVRIGLFVDGDLHDFQTSDYRSPGQS